MHSHYPNVKHTINYTRYPEHLRYTRLELKSIQITSGYPDLTMDAHTSSDVVGDGSGSRDAAVGQLDGDGVDMGGGVQVVLL